MLFSSDVGSGSKLEDLGFTAWMILFTSPSLVVARSIMGCYTTLCAIVSLLLVFVSEESITVRIFIILFAKSQEICSTSYAKNQCPAESTFNRVSTALNVVLWLASWSRSW